MVLGTEASVGRGRGDVPHYYVLGLLTRTLPTSRRRIHIWHIHKSFAMFDIIRTFTTGEEKKQHRGDDMSVEY